MPHASQVSRGKNNATPRTRGKDVCGLVHLELWHIHSSTRGECSPSNRANVKLPQFPLVRRRVLGLVIRCAAEVIALSSHLSVPFQNYCFPPHSIVRDKMDTRPSWTYTSSEGELGNQKQWAQHSIEPKRKLKNLMFPALFHL